MVGVMLLPCFYIKIDLVYSLTYNNIRLLIKKIILDLLEDVMNTLNKKIELLKKIALRFNDANITWALGASMLLYFKKITIEFHDIDLMIANEDVESVQKILSKMGEIQPPNPNSKYKTKSFMEFIIDSIDVDVMAGFSIVSDGKVHDCSLHKEQIVEWMTLENTKIPLQSPILWCEYYRLMGRKEKVDVIESALANN